jgi:hypothetical protein
MLSSAEAVSLELRERLVRVVQFTAALNLMQINNCLQFQLQQLYGGSNAFHIQLVNTRCGLLVVSYKPKGRGFYSR